MGRHEVRRVLRDLKLAELEMLLALIQKSANADAPAPGKPQALEKRG